MAPRQKAHSMTNAIQSPSKGLRKKAAHDETNIEEWIHRFLGNLAAIERDKEEKKKQHNMALKTTDRSRSLKATRTRLRFPTPYAWSRLRDHTVDSDDFDFDKEDGALITPVSKTRARVAKDLAVDGPHLVHCDPSLLQKINRYIITEDKRRAKRYVRKALSFAIEAGYLVPADRDGKLLRVSPALVAAGIPLVSARARRSQRTLSMRRGRRRPSGRVRRRASGRRRTVKARRRKASDNLKNVPATPPAVNNDQGNAVTTSAKRKKGEAPNKGTENNREQPDRPTGGSRKSNGCPSCSGRSSPSRRSRQKAIEDSAPSMSRAGSSEADRKPLSARSRLSSFARHSRDDDLLT